jgi:hypothetical protein
MVSGRLGEPLLVQLTDSDGNHAVASTAPVLLQAASNRPMTAADAESAISQLGDNTLTPAAIDLSGLELDQGRWSPAWGCLGGSVELSSLLDPICQVALVSRVPVPLWAILCKDIVVQVVRCWWVI